MLIIFHRRSFPNLLRDDPPSTMNVAHRARVKMDLLHRFLDLIASAPTIGCRIGMLSFLVPTLSFSSRCTRARCDNIIDTESQRLFSLSVRPRTSTQFAQQPICASLVLCRSPANTQHPTISVNNRGAGHPAFTDISTTSYTSASGLLHFATSTNT